MLDNTMPNCSGDEYLISIRKNLLELKMIQGRLRHLLKELGDLNNGSV